MPQSTVGRIESGEATCARWATVVGLLHAAGCCLRLDAGRDVAGNDRDGERDRAGRRYPAHLDVRPVTRFGTWWGDWHLLSTLVEKAWYLRPGSGRSTPSTWPGGAGTSGGGVATLVP